MNHGLKILLAAAGVLAWAGNAAADEPYRVPQTGNPALVADAPPGWTGQNISGTEMAISSADNLAILELAMISDPAMVAKPLPDIAHQVFINADLSPRWSSTEPDSIAGVPGQAFTVDIARDGVAVGVARVIIAKLDAGHAARLTEITLPKTTTPEELAALKELVSHLRISGR